MNVARLAATAVTPELEFNPDSAHISIKGECYPENPLAFFDPVFASLRRYFAEQKPSVFVARVQLQYVNSAATKAFRNLYLMLEELGKSGVSVRVEWVYDPEDDALEELGEDLAADLNYIDIVKIELTS